MNDGINDMTRARPYHHGDLRNGLLEAARTILEEEDLSQLTLRAVARKAGVSHAAPYRHFPNHEALLVELSLEGFRELREMVAEAARIPGPESDRTAHIGAAYMRFVAKRPAVARLMFGGQLTNREKFPALGEAADAVGTEIGNALPDPALGMAVWSAVHGLAMLSLENVIDLGQRRSGLSVLPEPGGNLAPKPVQHAARLAAFQTRQEIAGHGVIKRLALEQARDAIPDQRRQQQRQPHGGFVAHLRNDDCGRYGRLHYAREVGRHSQEHDGACRMDMQQGGDNAAQPGTDGKGGGEEAAGDARQAGGEGGNEFQRREIPM